MSGIEIFSIVSGICSIIGLIVSVFIASYTVNINKTVNNVTKKKINQVAWGDKNKQSNKS